ncbi:hypothetical protein KC345_g314 [Hortaea werneckii]|nr:hypothetical protein KC345_g314 [Hortaea werneckii]
MLPRVRLLGYALEGLLVPALPSIDRPDSMACATEATSDCSMLRLVEVRWPIEGRRLGGVSAKEPVRGLRWES